MHRQAPELYQAQNKGISSLSQEANFLWLFMLQDGVAEWLKGRVMRVNVFLYHATVLYYMLKSVITNVLLSLLKVAGRLAVIK